MESHADIVSESEAGLSVAMKRTMKHRPLRIDRFAEMQERVSIVVKDNGHGVFCAEPLALYPEPC